MTGEFGCDRCFGGDAELLWRAHPWHEVSELVDDSHFRVTIVACPDCRQQYIKLFTEFVAWTGDGDDAQHWDIMPLSDAEASELTARGEHVSLPRIEALSDGRRHLRIDFPSAGGSTKRFTSDRLWIVPGH
jgi:hypothetical protein